MNIVTSHQCHILLTRDDRHKLRKVIASAMEKGYEDISSEISSGDLDYMIAYISDKVKVFLENCPITLKEV